MDFGLASERMIAGSFPPSSSVTDFMWGAAAVRVAVPVDTDPVSEILGMLGCCVI